MNIHGKIRMISNMLFMKLSQLSAIFIIKIFAIGISNQKIFFMIKRTNKSKLLILESAKRHFKGAVEEICLQLLGLSFILLLKSILVEVMIKELTFGHWVSPFINLLLDILPSNPSIIQILSPIYLKESLHLIKKFGRIILIF